MNKLDSIIIESINKVIDEVRKSADEYWANLEGGTTVTRRKPASSAPTPRPRTVATSLYNSTTVNQIGRTLRSTWDSSKLKAICGFNRNAVRIYGIKNADALWGFFNDNGHDLFTQYQMKYNELSKLTRDIEQWARQGDINGVEYRLRDFPKPLEELADILTKLFNKCKNLKKLVTIKNIPLPGGMKPSIINGYLTSNGLNNLVIYNGNQKQIASMINNLRKCAEYIRNKWGDNLAHGKNVNNVPIDM